MASQASISATELDQLVLASIEAKSNSYSPYSKFRVGCALLTFQDRVIVQGCNVENASYGLTICAERCAIFKAVSQGYRKFAAVAISSDLETGFAYPCGACRQVLNEFGDMEVILVKDKTSIKSTRLANLLPHAFGPSDLEEAKRS
mmetsp:Transcript_9257/g.16163  ORF Transcript_9257/g.16163 Transcript_9257/m.16163 type:complete len:146 (+) Transcript_9257:111-548(+)|eukprot:CAMPEP_0184697638 /NCGR_PEP_ID=MMETSP0313-20130426/4539_1 /TAXON_ID=2792 /ORGANISM="Porphyridium aerugineum, Strain SAG 1380-2" /LENGTH=145 /DNA_ID=CAMNT_0027156457 /DNA_START=94 /DNA_END=531 /DNA_ORIENTATION=-